MSFESRRLKVSFVTGRKALNNIVGTVLMDLSKAYDCLSHDLLIAKLAAYRVDHHSLSFIHGYLKSRKHDVKIYDTFSEYLILY